MSDRLEYLKQTLDKQNNRPAVVLRRADAEWAASEIERLKSINESVCEELSGYRSLFDTLNLIDPRAVEKAIDIQEGGEKP